MATEVIKTVKSSGGDYTSLSAWEAGQQGDLPTLDEIHTAECYDIDDTTTVTVAGWTTDATRYIRIYAHSTARHAGVWDDTKYNLAVAGHCITVSEAYIRIDGLQLSCNPTTGGRSGILIDLVGTATYSATNQRISNCIIRYAGSSTNSCWGISMPSDAAVANAVVDIWNNIIYDFTPSTASVGILLSEADVTCNAYNNTVYGCDYNYRQTAGTFIAKNCGSAAHVTAGFDGTITQTTCSSTTPTFANEGARDLRLGSTDVTWHDQGTDNPGSGLFLDDIAAQTRVSVWDIGAYEYIVVGGTSRAGTLSLLGIGI